MYSHVFAIRFNTSIGSLAQVRFLAELFELPVSNGGRASDVYWCMLDHDGFSEFYSNTPDATVLLGKRLEEAELEGILVQVSPGAGSTVRFLRRVVVGFSAGALRALFRRKRD